VSLEYHYGDYNGSKRLATNAARLIFTDELGMVEGNAIAAA